MSTRPCHFRWLWLGLTCVGLCGCSWERGNLSLDSDSQAPFFNFEFLGGRKAPAEKIRSIRHHDDRLARWSRRKSRATAANTPETATAAPQPLPCDEYLPPAELPHTGVPPLPPQQQFE